MVTLRIVSKSIFIPLSVHKYFTDLCHWVANSRKSDKTLVTFLEATEVTGCTGFLRSSAHGYSFLVRTFNHSSINRSQWPRGLKLRSAACRVLGLKVSNPIGGMVVCIL